MDKKVDNNFPFWVAVVFTILFDIGFVFTNIALIKRVVNGQLPIFWLFLADAICLVVLSVFNIEVFKGLKSLLKK